MGRKIDMKKIENVTKCQVTFSKRRSSLMKKANEIAVCCDVDVAFLAFSPSGRVSKFCNQKRIEDVLHRYNLDLQLKKTGLELQILETDLRDYEIGPEQEPSLHQLSWCERNLNQSLQRVIARKIELESQSRKVFPTSVNQNEQFSMFEKPISGQILMQLDPWIRPYSPINAYMINFIVYFYSAKVRESIFQDLEGKQAMNENMFSSTNTLNHPFPSNLSKAPIQQSSSEQSLMMDHQSLFSFHDHDNASSVVFSDAVHMSTQNSRNMHLDPSNARIDNNVDFRTTNFDQMQRNYQQFHHEKEASQGPQFDNLAQETEEDNKLGSLNRQKSSPWEWDDLLLDETFNF
ncbi:hypothetical protein SASPL_138035 [Salvia splendens]|uniref:MADS-box domain-containing protein n=1 Tax=Salvia splendens TaxID=180675 RepID=A0A8X8ZDI2_SALSN|nr:hypothetical protein SASPL_138035 [Salvia splendens]